MLRLRRAAFPGLLHCASDAVHQEGGYVELGGNCYREFKNLCDHDLLLRIGRAKYRIGHVRMPLANHRFHKFGQSADLRICANSNREREILKRENGCPAGFRGEVFTVYGRMQRQFQKLLLRGQMDLISGHYHIKRQYIGQAKFSSNIGLDKLEKQRPLWKTG